MPHDAGGPAFYVKDVTFTKIVVDDEVRPTGYGTQGDVYTVFYAATDDGRVYKVARWQDSRGRFDSRLLDILHVTSPDEPIRAMALSSKSRSLIVATDASIKQVSLTEICSKQYKNCVQCVHDPYCGWDRERGECQPSNPYLLQAPQGEAEGICEASMPRPKISANFGSSVHLSCAVDRADPDSIGWYFYDAKHGKRHHIAIPTDKYVFTQDNGLVIIGMHERDAGRYDCRLDRETVSSYEVAVDLQRCAAPNKTADYQKVYSDWCHEFQKYKLALKNWEKNKDKCGGPPPPNPSAAGGQPKSPNSVYSPLV